MKLKTLIASGSLVFAALAASPGANAAGTLNVALHQDPGNWDPIATFLVSWGAVGSQIFDGLIIRTPLIRGIVASSTYSQFAQTLATLLANGVPVLQALGIVEQTVTNAVIAHEIRNARARVTDGTTISGPLAAGKVFPEMMTDMLAIGEQTGDLPAALTHIANRYQNELDRNIKIFTSALEPLLIVFMAILVGFVAISMLLAVFSLSNGLNVK